MKTLLTFDSFTAQLAEFLPMGSVNALRSEAWVYWQQGLSAEHAATWLVNYHGAMHLDYDIPAKLVMLLSNLQTPRKAL